MYASRPATCTKKPDIHVRGSKETAVQMYKRIIYLKHNAVSVNPTGVIVLTGSPQDFSTQI